ncbi:hypothetical protein PPL_06694 [Heterostelium album PN500]|uniref:SAM domain-containing protein n=1 Tax=Heterostelium pallidum (strain ATCC 26659 / Pp 5 / PN500) TaxID=670386 RepID=D3BFG0_HETP5|nr:hypothetical protein PPL_06694 [Heterostelium album PN500]EFA79874.1 hypothetical protein PPL_06694 [Heterostelium album PN500]|eukprot:XP_020431995.1 hypothetical protein PPL_06694 [Heterostelium album PN500]
MSQLTTTTTTSSTSSTHQITVNSTKEQVRDWINSLDLNNNSIGNTLFEAGIAGRHLFDLTREILLEKPCSFRLSDAMDLLAAIATQRPQQQQQQIEYYLLQLSFFLSFLCLKFAATLTRLFLTPLKGVLVTNNCPGNILTESKFDKLIDAFQALLDKQVKMMDDLKAIVENNNMVLQKLYIYPTFKSLCSI